jgi:hypothetical protein
VDDLYVDEGVCLWSVGVCVCVCVGWDFGGDMWCSLRQFEGHNGKEGSVFFAYHVPPFIFLFRVLCSP